MSFEMVEIVREIYADPSGIELKSSEKAFLILLASYHNAEQGCAWPSVQRMAKELATSVVSIRAVRRTLEGKTASRRLKPCIEVVRRAIAPGQNETNLYFFTPEFLARQAKEPDPEMLSRPKRPGRPRKSTFVESEPSEEAATKVDFPKNKSGLSPERKSAFIEAKVDFSQREPEGLPEFEDQLFDNDHPSSPDEYEDDDDDWRLRFQEILSWLPASVRTRPDNELPAEILAKSYTIEEIRAKRTELASPPHDLKPWPQEILDDLRSATEAAKPRPALTEKAYLARAREHFRVKYAFDQTDADAMARKAWNDLQRKEVSA